MAAKTKEGGKVVEMPAHERRTSIRYPFTAAVDAVEMGSQTRLSARSSDLGRGGCFIDTVNPFPVGTDVSLRLTADRKTFEARARVVYAQPGMGMGLSFTLVEPDQLWILEKWLGKLGGELSPELKEGESAADSRQERAPETETSVEAGFVLNELIIALMRKRVLTESEGKQLLKKLMS